MKSLKKSFLPSLLALAALAGAETVFAQETAFTYQGQLISGSNPANGTYDLVFTLYGKATGGAAIAGPVTNSATGVTNGLFTTTLDFGAGTFTGGSNWLAIAVRTNGPGALTTLAPRQPLTPTPLAVFAANAGNVAAGNVSGTLTAGQLPAGVVLNNSMGVNLNGTFAGNGNGLTGLNASQLTTGTVPTARLAADLALLDVSQTYTGVPTFSGPNQALIVNGGPVGANLFTGLGLQFNPGTGEGALMASVNDAHSSLGFYTKPAMGSALVEQGHLSRYGALALDYAGANAGTLNDGTTNSAGLIFGGGGSGEGIASQRTPGVNQYGLDFYTGFNHVMSLLNNGNVGVGVTNPASALQVAGTVNATAFVGDGSGLTNLTASRLGTIPIGQLPPVLGLLTDPGTQNLYLGAYAGTSSGTGTDNTGVGTEALGDLSTGGFNSGQGAFALHYDTSGSYNTANGAYALSAQFVSGYVTGSGNTADGAYALAANSPGSNNVAVGYGAMQNAGSDNGAVAIGYQALQNDTFTSGFLINGSGDTAVGCQALQANTSGSGNTGVGYQALKNTTTGYNDTAAGLWALFSNVTGNNNTANGTLAQLASTGADNNTANGTAALQNNLTGENNTANGAFALQGTPGGANSGGGNTAAGAYAMNSLTTGYNNTAAGLNALAANTTGVDNIAIGVSSFYTNAAGSLNTVVGTYGFQYLNSGGGNVGLGYAAGYYLNNGSDNIYIGNYGYNATENNTMRLGGVGSITTTVIAGNNVGINNNNPTAALDVSGEYLVVEGLGGVRCYLGDDGSGNDVQIGSLKHGITAVAMYNATDNAYMHLYCSSITIEGGADLAEPFPITDGAGEIASGAVMVIDELHPGHLKPSSRAYDTRVAGVISGANGINPGIQMQQQGLLEGGKNVALTGRVYVQADCSNGAILPGDLLTTSGRAGHAMKVTDHARAQGAILGKAMTGLADGNGMVLVLVTLQ